VYSLYIIEDDSECRPECNPLTVNVTLSSTYGELNILGYIPNENYNADLLKSRAFNQTIGIINN